MEQTPLVSVIIPTHNRAELLTTRAIPSVLNQTYLNFELIIIGDQCIDDTKEKVNKFNDPRIIFEELFNRPPLPDDPRDRWRVAASAPRNRGLEIAHGDWICFLDDDDEFMPDHIDILLKKALTGYDFVHGNMLIINPDGERIILGKHPPERRFISTGSYIYNSKYKDIKCNLDPDATTEVEDWNLIRRIIEAGARVAYVDEIVYKYYPAQPFQKNQDMLSWTGERYIPWMELGEVHYNHLHRYYFAVNFCKGKRVLDLGCGEGYGPNILSNVADEVIGIDVDKTTINHASNKYAKPNLTFMQGSVTDVPIQDYKFDVIVSFELLEHIEDHQKYISEVKRLLMTDGVFIVSTPNKAVYTNPDAPNPFHKRELNLDEFVKLIESNFNYSRFLAQRSFTGSNIWSVSSNTYFNCDELYVNKKEDRYELAEQNTKKPIIYIAVASNHELEKELDYAYKWLIDTSHSLIRGLNHQIEELRNRLKAEETKLQALQAQSLEKDKFTDEKVRQLEYYQNSIIVKILKSYSSLLNRVIPPGTLARGIHDSLYYFFNRSIRTQNNLGTKLSNVHIKKVKKPHCLGVLLCYNDADILPDVIDHLISNKHDLVAWNHGSDDDTGKILNKYKKHFKEITFIPRSFDFYKLYPEMSKNIMDKYIGRYDWISWPDQDEILEGPDREKSYFEYLCDAYDSKYNYIRFNNINYWFSSEDDETIVSPIKRIKRYSIFTECAPRIRSWRASVTNIREFNHNTLAGEQYPVLFNLRHYPMRSVKQVERRLAKDRINLQRDGQNYHFDNLKKNYDKLFINPEQLYYDDGISPLVQEKKFDWQTIYGYPPGT